MQFIQLRNIVFEKRGGGGGRGVRTLKIFYKTKKKKRKTFLKHEKIYFHGEWERECFEG